MSATERYGTRIPSEREQRVIQLVAQGLKNREVADEIGTTEHVVKNYLRVIYDKLGLWNRVELALWYESRRPGPALPCTVDAVGIGCAATSLNRRTLRGRAQRSIHKREGAVARFRVHTFFDLDY